MKELMGNYPFNLMVEIFSDEEKAMETTLKGLNKALLTLTEREQSVLSMRYKDKLTLKECGKNHNVTQERIRQIAAKALRKLRHPGRCNLMKAVPYSDMLAEWNSYNELEQDYKLLKEAFETLTSKPTEPDEIQKAINRAQNLKQPLADLDLSVRSYNCLRRAGKNTIGDIVAMSELDLTKIRNLGRKSMDEIVAYLQRYELNLREE